MKEILRDIIVIILAALAYVLLMGAINTCFDTKYTDMEVVK